MSDNEKEGFLDVSDDEKKIKKIKKKILLRTPHKRQPAAMPSHKKPNAAGMRLCNRSLQPEKSPRASTKRKEANKKKSLDALFKSL